jgi:DNA-binding XRE family transcriptional regulator
MDIEMGNGLTPGERFWLFRKRAKRSQRKAARRLGLGRITYYRIEHDAHPAPACVPDITFLTAPERLRLARRRSGLTAMKIARSLGVSRVTFMEWEGRADPRLRAWWASQKGGSPSVQKSTGMIVRRFMLTR